MLNPQARSRFQQTSLTWVSKQEEARADVDAGLSVRWADHLDDVRAAQRLRYDVFVGEMGAQLSGRLDGHDIDDWDDWCEHLLVEVEGQVVGTYRVLTPAQARRRGALYTEGEFDLSAVVFDRAHTVELGRSCVHPTYRTGAVILALWGALAEFMARNQLHTMIGCASISMRAGAHAAASAWRQIADAHVARHGHCSAWPARAWYPLPVDELQGDWPAEPPALIKGYQRLGARVLGAPAWDAEFNTADVPMLMHANELPTRYRRLMERACA